MSLDLLPEEIIHHILGFSQCNEIFRLRHTSRRYRDIISRNSELKRRLEIPKIEFPRREDLKACPKILELVPLSRCFFGIDIFQTDVKEDVDRLVDAYGPKVLTLKIPQMYIPMSDWERSVFERMSNLKEIYVSEIKNREDDEDDEVPIETPANFVQLEKLTVGEFDCFLGFQAFLRKCSKLEEIKMKYEHSFFWCTEILECITEYITKPETNLKKLVFNRGTGLGKYSDDAAHEFINAVGQHGVWIYNIPSSFIEEFFVKRVIVNPEEKDLFLSKVVSIEGFCSQMTDINFLELKSLQFDLCDSKLNDCGNSFPTEPKYKLNSLEKLDFFVDLKHIPLDSLRVRNNVLKLWNYFFDFRRDGLKKISVVLHARLPDVPFIVNTQYLAENFKNLQSLTLNVFFMQQEHFCSLFTALGDTVINTLRLVIHCNVNNYLFVGLDVEQPAFLKMKHLRHVLIMNRMQPHGEVENAQPVDVALDFVEGVLPLTHLSCLHIVCYNNTPEIFQKTVPRLDALAGANIGSSLREIIWENEPPLNEDGLDVKAAEGRLEAKIQHNRENTIRIGVEKCKLCALSNL